jgi:hypothetical protein
MDANAKAHAKTSEAPDRICGAPLTSQRYALDALFLGVGDAKQPDARCQVARKQGDAARIARRLLVRSLTALNWSF